jgi:hypothetical protein
MVSPKERKSPKNAENCSKKYIGLQLDFSNELLIG